MTRLESGRHLDTVGALRDVVVSAQNERSIRLSDVARVTDADAPPTSHVRFYSRDGGSHPAVTLAVAKRKGANAITVAHQVEAKLATVRPHAWNLNVTVTRNYGETAAEKSNELLYHMFLAVVSVSILIALALGLREALVVLIATPVTLALTLFAFWAHGHTLNRITLFALIFSIGILVDDAIVVVENIVRHACMRSEGASGLVAIAVRAVDEVGNPTILATLTVVAAILPMAFVGGLMGSYMRPIPVGASAAMLFSLAAAFLVTLGRRPPARVGSAHGHAPEGAATRRYRRAMTGLIGNGRMRLAFWPVLPSCSSRRWRSCCQARHRQDAAVRQQERVSGDGGYARGDTLEHTARVASELAHEVLKDTSVVNVQSYVGPRRRTTSTAWCVTTFSAAALTSPTFRSTSPRKTSAASRATTSPSASGIVSRRSHGGSAPRSRSRKCPRGRRCCRRLVAEVYGPDPSRRLVLAGQVKSVLEQTPGVVDVDCYVAAPQAKTSLVADDSRRCRRRHRVARVGCRPDGDRGRMVGLCTM